MNLIDQRGSGDVERHELTGQDGRKKIEFLIRDFVKSGMGAGEFDRLLATLFGVSR